MYTNTNYLWIGLSQYNDPVFKETFYSMYPDAKEIKRVKNSIYFKLTKEIKDEH